MSCITGSSKESVLGLCQNSCEQDAYAGTTRLRIIAVLTDPKLLVHRVWRILFQSRPFLVVLGAVDFRVALSFYCFC